VPLSSLVVHLLPLRLSLVLPPKKKRRDLPLVTKHEILRFAQSHTMTQTMNAFPEISMTALKRLKRNREVTMKGYHPSRGTIRRMRPLAKYKVLGEHLHKFFVGVRDAQGAVNRALLEECILGLPDDVQLDLMQKGEHRRDEFFVRWRRWYKIVYRRITGVKQFLPDDYATRVRNFHYLLRSMFFEKRHTLIFCGDETGVRFEELPNVTMAEKGSQKVQVRTSGQEKNMFTVFLHSSMRLDDWGNLLSVQKEKPVIIFKGAEDGPVARQVAEAAGARAGII